MLGALLGLIAFGAWLAFSLARSSRFRQHLQHRDFSRERLARFADKTLSLNAVDSILRQTQSVTEEVLGATGLMVLQMEEGVWRASRADGTRLQRLPDRCARLMTWFVHNPVAIVRSDLHSRRFGAMRALLREMMNLYEVGVVLPLVDRGRLLAVVGIPMERSLGSLDRELLRLLLLEVTAAVANIRLHHEAVHMVSLSREVDVAASIELSMAPEAMDGENQKMAWAGHYAVAGRVGSDFWEVYPLGGDRIMVVLGDAVGQDLAGTMVAAVVKSACDTVFDESSANITPSRLLSILNGSLYRPNHQALCTCFAALFDPERNMVQFANAGHEIPYRLSMRGGMTRLGSLSARGPLLGESENWDFVASQEPFEDNETFVFTSNGVINTRNPAGELYGSRRLQRLLLGASDHDAGAVRDLIYESIKHFRSSAGLVDDQALVVLRAA